MTEPLLHDSFDESREPLETREQHPFAMGVQLGQEADRDDAQQEEQRSERPQQRRLGEQPGQDQIDAARDSLATSLAANIR